MNVDRLKIWLPIAAAVLCSCSRTNAQSYSKGQMVYTAHEGWQQNPDGSYRLLFGYMNLNWEEEFDLPIGTDNKFEPGNLDQGQPTHFFPRRNRFVFWVNVPKDFGDKELVWSITAHGKSSKAYATLRQDYFIDNMILTSENGAIGGGFSSPEIRRNQPPVLEAAGDGMRPAKVGETLTLSAHVTDDGIPKPRARGADLLDRGRGVEVKDIRTIPPRQVSVGSATGLWTACYLYRSSVSSASSKVHFSPAQPKTWEDTRAGANSQWSPLWQPPPPPPDGKWTVQVTFDEPGTYVLRWHATDGALWANQDITVTVTP
jgi:hypothetical protein